MITLVPGQFAGWLVCFSAGVHFVAEDMGHAHALKMARHLNGRLYRLTRDVIVRDSDPALRTDYV